MREQRLDGHFLDAELSEEGVEGSDLMRELGVFLELRRLVGESERVFEREAVRLADELREKSRDSGYEVHGSESYPVERRRLGGVVRGRDLPP
jgi:hypothetical protein